MSKVLLGDVAVEHKETCKGSKDGYPIVGLEHLIPEEITLTAWDEGCENTFTKMFRKGNVLFGRRRAYLKKAAVAPFDGICSGDITVIEAKPDRILPELLPFIIQNDALFDFAVGKSAGSLSPRVKWEHLKNYEFELPDMDKQRELAALLWAMDETKKSYQKLIAATDELVKSQFIEMFGDPVTNPLGWELVRLDDLCSSIVRGPFGSALKVSYFVPKTENTVKVYEQKNAIQSSADLGTSYITQEKYEELLRFRCGPGDILMSCSGTIGCLYQLPEDAEPGIINQALCKFRLNDRILPIVFLTFMRQSVDQLETKGTGIQNIGAVSYIKNMKIPLAPHSVQEQFATFVRQSDKSKLLVTKSIPSSYYACLLSNHLNHNKGGIEVETKRNTFAAYLEDEYYDLMFNRLKTHVYQNKSRLNLHTSLVINPSYIALDDIHVMGVTFKETEDDRILFRAAVQTDIVVKGKTRCDYEEDMASAWFAVSFTGILRGGLTMVTITSVEDYTKEYFSKEDALTKFLVPYVYAKDLDLHAEKFLNKYCRRALETPMPLPIKEVLEAMCLTVYPAPLPDGIFGRTYFNRATVDIYKDCNSDEIISAEIEEGTILVSPDSFFMRNIGCMHNTIIHECVHWDKHYKFFELQKLINPEITSISCKVVEQYKKDNDELSNELEWMEWQASAIAPKILIPARTGRIKLNEILIRLTHTLPTTRRAEIMQLAISEFADFFQVSTMAAKIRAIELGFEQAAGVFNYVDGHYYPPFSFTKGVLKKDQTFIIDRNNAIFESTFNETLAKEYRAGHFIHAGGMFVINDPKYVHIQEDAEAELTDYALEHIDECCLIFNRETRVSKHYDDSYYRICFLCRDADSKSFVEANFNPREGKNEDVLKRAQEMSTIMAEAKRVSEILADIPSSFCGTLDYHVKRRGYTNEKMEERTGISSRMIQDYRNKRDAKPTLPSVLALCIGLNLQPAFPYDLISKAGHNIMTPLEENLVYQYLINNHHMENIRMWNQKLQDAGIAQQLPKNGNKNTAP